MFLDAIIDYVPRIEPGNVRVRSRRNAQLVDCLWNSLCPGQALIQDAQTVCDYLFSDGSKLVKCAKELRNAMNTFNPFKSVLNYAADSAFKYIVKQGTQAVLKAIFFDKYLIVKALKEVVKLGFKVAENVFHTAEKLRIAENIRFISLITIGLQSGVYVSREAYLSDNSEGNAYNYMQLLAFLLNVRAIGESQAAEFGIAHEYNFLNGLANGESRELLDQAKIISGDSGVNSWVDWRDSVEDRISLTRVKLLRNIAATTITGLEAPVVSFDYENCRTVQPFDDTHEYSTDAGQTWTKCTGDRITIEPSYSIVDLLVRKTDIEQTDMKGVGHVIVNSITSMVNSDVTAKKVKGGYVILGLDHTKNYELQFVKGERTFEYGTPLEVTVPTGSYTFEYPTDEEYTGIYLRTKADKNGFASAVGRINSVTADADYVIGSVASCKDDIGMNMFIKLPEVNKVENAKLIVTPERKNASSYELPFDGERMGSDGSYIVSYDVVAKEINDDYTVEVVVNDKTRDFYRTSVSSYLNTIIKNEYDDEEYAKAQELATALLNYGSAAQELFGYNTEQLANYLLSKAQKQVLPITTTERNEYTQEYWQVSSKIGSLSDVTFEGSQLLLRGKTQYRVLFSAGLDKYNVQMNGEDVQVKVSGDYRSVTFEGKSPNELLSDIKITLSPKDPSELNGSEELTFNPLSYVNLAIDLPDGGYVGGFKNENVKKAATALFRYCKEGIKYLDAYVSSD